MTDDHEVRHVRHVDDEQRYELVVGDEVASLLTYECEGDVLDLLHTETAEGFEGRGLAGELVAAVLADLRERGLTMRPTCPYVQHYLTQHPDQQDLVAPSAAP